MDAHLKESKGDRIIKEKVWVGPSSEMSRLISISIREYGESYVDPLMILDVGIVRLRVKLFMQAMPRVKPHYAIKANPEPAVLRTVHQEKGGFEVASLQEIDLLENLGFLSDEVQYSNPIKSERSIRVAAEKGVKWFTFDSECELRKIATLSPNACLAMRIDVSNEGSDWPLNEKFGVRSDEVNKLLSVAFNLRANLRGLTFHVGSQCKNPQNWVEAIRKIKHLLTETKKMGFTIKLLNLGGGFPIELTRPVPSIKKIGELINRELFDIPDHIRVIAEPGRFLVGESACLMTQVITISEKDGQKWIYLDVGVFGGLLELSQGLPYLLWSPLAGNREKFKIAGPTCDGMDILPGSYSLPARLSPGDFVFILNAGAYTNVYSSNFNGFPSPAVICLNP